MKTHPAANALALPFAEGELRLPETTLFLGATPHPFLGSSAVVGWQPFKPTADAWQKSDRTLLEAIPAESYPTVLVLPGKSRDETLHWFALARKHLAPGGTIAVSMPNTAGAERFEKELAAATGEIVARSKHKCRVFHATENGAWNEETFAAWATLGGMKPVLDTPFVTEAGIFSHGRIDAGSQLLAAHLPANLRGKVADLGAGWGFLSHAVLTRCPAVETLDLYEADSRALACARQNLTEFLQPAFHWHDVTTGLPETYDTIVMNPPFHTGQATDVDLGRAFLATAHAALKRGGSLLLVANRQLSYEAALDQLGFRWRKPVETDTFKLLFANKR